MTYLAVQISLYLACATLIGICLGWLFWGRSYHRRIAKLHAEMTTSLEAERNLSEGMRRELDDAEARLNANLDSEKANSAKTIAEVQELLRTEKEATRTARAEIDQLRLDKETAVGVEKTSASNAIQEAMQHAERMQDTVDQAKTRETQIQAELEELRLMAGAEKLAAQTARAEAEQLRRNMQVAIDAERETSKAAREALDDIQATLARTFGEGAGIVAALGTRPETPTKETAGISPGMSDESQEIVDGKKISKNGDPQEKTSVSDVSEPFKLSSNEAEPGTAFNVTGEKVAAPEEPEQTADHIVSVEPNLAQEIDDQTPLDGDDHQSPDLDHNAAIQFNRIDPTTAAEAKPTDEDGKARPSSFYEERPDEVDRLQEIGGIDSEMEKLLNEQGCYQFKQLAHFSADDIDWLAQTLSSMSDLKERIERDGWIEQARELQIKKYMTTNADRPRWWSRRRLQ